MLFVSALIATLPVLTLASAGHASSQGHRAKALAARAVAADEKATAALLEKGIDITKRQGSGARFTFYDTSVGLGACGVYHGNNEYTVALNSGQLNAAGGGYPPSVCGKQITIEYNGKQVQATIQDECPTCPWGGLDLSMGLFSAIANQDAGVVYGNWWYGGGQSNTPTTPAAPAEDWGKTSAVSVSSVASVSWASQASVADQSRASEASVAAAQAWTSQASISSVSVQSTQAAASIASVAAASSWEAASRSSAAAAAAASSIAVAVSSTAAPSASASASFVSADDAAAATTSASASATASAAPSAVVGGAANGTATTVDTKNLEALAQLASGFGQIVCKGHAGCSDN